MIKKCKILLLIPILFLMTSCSFSMIYKDKKFLSFNYFLNNVGDIHGASPTGGNSISQKSGFTSYKKEFDLKNSYMNFKCVGDSFENYHCQTTLLVKNSKGDIILDFQEPFDTTYVGTQDGVINYSDPYVKSTIGKIYATSVYWVRFQYNYDLKGDGNKILLTFEFWKKGFNEPEMWTE